jgi:hypothetical protein
MRRAMEHVFGDTSAPVGIGFCTILKNFHINVMRIFRMEKRAEDYNFLNFLH